jgi:hypothetical protein
VKPIIIGVEGRADRLLVAGMREIAPVLAELGPGALVIGGLMTRIWMHARPIELPARVTADVDLGIDKRILRITGGKRIVGPLLERHRFFPGYDNEPFRYSRELDGLGTMIVDVVIARDASRHDPPMLEAGLETVAAPGLTYAQLRGPVAVVVRFVDGEDIAEFQVNVPHLDAAFVLKAALAHSGVRTRPDRVQNDSVDAIMLAAACSQEPASIEALREHRRRADVRKSLGWMEKAFRSPSAAGAGRVERHVADQGGGSGGGEWAHRIALALSSALDESGR